ncbi:MAG TPA: hypothetical protein PKD77_08270 [Rudaea sp.]|mgnify:FL=1|nr:hypothetical protein [Pseudomonadota bacterium]HMM57565.1 hypothetical protein [Rudaea sp.]
MATEAQRSAMLAAMGIDVYRLRAAPTPAAPLCVSLGERSCVCVDGGDAESVQRLHDLLPATFGIARERVVPGACANDLAIVVDESALRGSAAGKRALWQALKPLARRLHGLD